ncbi:MAG: SGNH/GDSL hydrolase family protein [Roseibacillus sp.]
MKSLLLFIATTLLAAPANADPLLKEGDHIAIVGNTFADQLRIHGYLETLLQQHTDISLRNLGWAGDTLTQRDRPTNFPTETTTLTEQKTDLIIACFGMSESFAGEPGIPAFKNDLKAFLASHKGQPYNGESDARIALVSPIAYEDHGLTTPNVEGRNKDLAAYTAAMAETAEQEGVLFIDLYEDSRAIMDNIGDQKLTTNGIHLTPLGYWAAAKLIASKLTDSPLQPWVFIIDASSDTAANFGAELTEISTDEGALSFKVTETTPASPPPPTGDTTPSYFKHGRDTLIVENLAPGDYTLTVDGKEVTTASHEQWHQGVQIDNSPAHQEAEAFRAAINDKNLQFLYNWKALNQVHIVGERTRSPSGKSIPSEQAEFNKLAQQQEAILRQPHQPKTRQWTLTPSKSTKPIIP